MASKNLVIVESPTKARTITRFLPPGTTVMASMGHIRDLPEGSLAVDVQNHFQPQYVLSSRKNVVQELKLAVRKADDIYLASDPDREGEAIAWHLYEVLKKEARGQFHRISFHEITSSAIKAALREPGEIDLDKVNAQQARRVLDRLVGYQVSPELWKSVQKGTSAGRVQSVALRLVVERERAIQAFKPVEYWNLDADFSSRQPTAKFTARLAKLDGQKPEIGDADTANAMAEELSKATFAVVATARKPSRKSAPPPFITSTLQQAASSNLRLSTAQTMRLAQQLYEGVELGESGAVGLITYMRTDSVNLAKEAVEACRQFIGKTYGAKYLPERPNVYKSGKAAQEAHEAIRPTDVRQTPEAVRPYLTPEQFRLYQLIWNRFVACQMAPAEFLDHSIDVAAKGRLRHDYLFHATARQSVFPGYQKVYDLLEPDQAEEKAARSLPELPDGTPCSLDNLDRTQCFTEPPFRFSEATLVKELEQNGIGRPSTYASIVNTILDRDYVGKDKGRLVPTPLGFKVNDYLVEHMPKLFQVKFTAEMESQLDAVEAGEVEWTDMLSGFYEQFRGWLPNAPTLAAPSDLKDVKKLLALFPPKLKWEKPVVRRGRTYDDAKFVASLLEQAEEGKPFSDKQWNALVAVAVKYAGQAPKLADHLRQEGVDVDGMQAAAEEAKAKREEAPGASDEDRALLAPLDRKNFPWEPAVKKGSRTYDDAKFFRSLRAQALDEGKALSEPQRQALRKMLFKYREQIPDFDKLGLATTPVTTGTGTQAETADPAECAQLVQEMAKVKEWAPPTTRGRFSFNDKEFAESLKQQFETKGQLSVRQLEALRKMLTRYGVLAKAPPAEVAANCPQCGAKLVERSSRAGKFYGCSAFPKCRFLTRSLESLGK